MIVLGKVAKELTKEESLDQGTKKGDISDIMSPELTTSENFEDFMHWQNPVDAILDNKKDSSEKNTLGGMHKLCLPPFDIMKK